MKFQVFNLTQLYQTFLKKIKDFIYLFACAVLHVGSCSPTRDQTCAPCTGSTES